jgi:hypothetical protein
MFKVSIKFQNLISKFQFGFMNFVLHPVHPTCACAWDLSLETCLEHEAEADAG